MSRRRRRPAAQAAHLPVAPARVAAAVAATNPPSCSFPRGWANEKFYLQAVSPQEFPIPGTPTGWTPGTNGLVRGEVVLVTETTQEELKAKYAGGKLRGKWVITAAAPDVAAYWNPPASAYTKEELERMDSPEHPAEFGVDAAGRTRRRTRRTGGCGWTGPRRRQPRRGRRSIATTFFKSEGVLGTLSTAPRGHGIYTIGGSVSDGSGRRGCRRSRFPPSSTAASRGCSRRACRSRSKPTSRTPTRPTRRCSTSSARFRGTDKADEVVMLGAHFDSWHASTGATDNGAGSAAMMEAMRILKQRGVRLRRTVRIGLWTGEEQGLLGSRDYVARALRRAAAPGGGRGGAGAARGRASRRRR